MQVLAMVHKEPTVSSTSSCSTSPTVRDEGSSLGRCRVCHSVSEIGINRKSDGKNTKNNRGDGMDKHKLVKNEAEETDDLYYLRWNPTGDYDTDDDWWNEVVALERKDRRRNRKMEKRIKIAAARVLEEALYQRYKYHTGKVMKWGNTLWTDRYSGQNSDGDKHHLSLRTVIGRLNHLALHDIAMPPVIYRHLEHAVELREEFQTRYVSRRKKEEGSHAIRKARRRNDMGKPLISVSLSGRKSYDESSDDAIIDVGRKDRGNLGKTTMNPKANIIASKTNEEKHKWILNQLKALLDRFHNKASATTSIPKSKDNVDFDSLVGAEASCDSQSRKNETNCEVPIDPRTSRKYRRGKDNHIRSRDKNCAKKNHKILVKPNAIEKNPLNGKYDRNKREKNGATINCKFLTKLCTTDNKCVDKKRDRNNRDKNCEKNDGKILMKPCATDKNPFENRRDIVKNCDKKNYKSLANSCTTDGYPFDEENSTISKDGNCDENVSKNILESSAIDKYCFDDKSESSSSDDIFGQDGIAATTLASFTSSTSTSSPSTIGGDNQCLDHYSTSQSTLEDWDEIFGDDGSLIGDRQNSDHDSESRNLHIVMSIKTQPLQDEAENSLNTKNLNFGNHLESDRNVPSPKEEITKKDMRWNSAEVANLSNNSVRTNISSQSHNENLIDENKSSLPQKMKDVSDDSNKKKAHPEMIISQTNSEVREIPSMLNDRTRLISVQTNSLLLVHSRQYDSVWDMSHLEDEEATNFSRIHTSIETTSLQNSNPPEDWEMLFEEEEDEETSIEETNEEFTQTILSSTTQVVELKTDATQLRETSGVCKISLFPCKKNGTENKHPNTSISQHGSDQVVAKLTKPAYNVTEILNFDSVWDIFASEKTSGCVEVTENTPITVSAITTDETAQPEEDWEALYS